MILIWSSISILLLGSVVPSAIPTISAVLIGLLGVPHGAVDLHLVSSHAHHKRELLLYLIRIALVVCAWLIVPALMLAVFLVNSAWHFGDCDLPSNGRYHGIRASIYGAAILVLVVNPTDPAVGAILVDLIRGPVDVSMLTHYAELKLVAAILVAVLPALGAQAKRPTYLLRSVVIIAMAYLVDSLLAFTWYFTVVHAYTSMNALRHHLGQEQPWSWRRLCIAALPLSLVSWTGIGLAIVLLPNSNGLVALFVALSALTLPHSVLFHRIYKMRQ